LENILQTYNVYDPQVGYVQGLNLIAGILLYCCEEEYQAFWLLAQLLEFLELRDVF
jgi:hypothetical protein